MAVDTTAKASTSKDRRRVPWTGPMFQIAPDGQILVDVSKLYQWPKGQPSAFNDPGAFLPT